MSGGAHHNFNKHFIHSQEIAFSPHPFLPWGRVTTFMHISGGAYSNLLTQDSISSYLPTFLTVALTILCASNGMELCLLSSQDRLLSPPLRCQWSWI